MDSEHNALFQLLAGRDASEVQPSRAHRLRRAVFPTPGSLDDVTPEDALRHPSWSMGAKVTIDSATLMNKGLEVIEAHWLFGMPLERIAVVVHPQSIVHGAVEFADGALLAHLSPPDMRIPIAAALYHPRARRAALAASRPGERSAGWSSSRPTTGGSRRWTWPTRPSPAAARRPRC